MTSTLFFFFFKEEPVQRNSIPLLRMHQTLIFGQDIAQSKDARRVRERWKIRLHLAWPS